jgi:hypothetical protein
VATPSNTTLCRHLPLLAQSFLFTYQTQKFRSAVGQSFLDYFFRNFKIFQLFDSLIAQGTSLTLSMFNLSSNYSLVVKLSNELPVGKLYYVDNTTLSRPNTIASLSWWTPLCRWLSCANGLFLCQWAFSVPTVVVYADCFLLNIRP